MGWFGRSRARVEHRVVRQIVLVVPTWPLDAGQLIARQPEPLIRKLAGPEMITGLGLADSTDALPWSVFPPGDARTRIGLGLFVSILGLMARGVVELQWEGPAQNPWRLYMEGGISPSRLRAPELLIHRALSVHTHAPREIAALEDVLSRTFDQPEFGAWKDAIQSDVRSHEEESPTAALVNELICECYLRLDDDLYDIEKRIAGRVADLGAPASG